MGPSQCLPEEIQNACVPCRMFGCLKAIHLRNGRFYFKVNNCKEVAKDGVNYFCCLSKLNYLSKNRNIGNLRFYLSIKDKNNPSSLEAFYSIFIA